MRSFGFAEVCFLDMSTIDKDNEIHRNAERHPNTHTQDLGTGPGTASTNNESFHPQQQCDNETRMDGGVVAWLQVFGSWILFWNTW